MKKIYRQLQNEAIRIARKYPAPGFYRDFENEIACSSRFFSADAPTRQIHAHIVEKIENDYGHGIDHARKVALDAGALVLIEGGESGYGDAPLTRLLRGALCAGLLHDICRKEKNHAKAGAKKAGRILADYGFPEKDISEICLAIANHQAFGDNRSSPTKEGGILSDSLYDADKFRWGPENFTHTVWSMVNYMDISLADFMKHFPRGMNFLKLIRSTFRTPTGQKYGPRFIDIGLAIGDDLYECIRSEYAEHMAETGDS